MWTCGSIEIPYTFTSAGILRVFLLQEKNDLVLFINQDPHRTDKKIKSSSSTLITRCSLHSKNSIWFARDQFTQKDVNKFFFSEVIIIKKNCFFWKAFQAMTISNSCNGKFTFYS